MAKLSRKFSFFIFILMARRVNLQKHKKFSKWVFYIFYPLHLIILGLLKAIL